MMRRCRICGNEKSPEDFERDRGYEGGRATCAPAARPEVSKPEAADDS